MNHSVLLKSSVLLIAAAFSLPALASGYHFGTQSVSSQSTANSSAAEAADPSTLFYNPAGLTHLEGTQATVNVNLVMPSVKYSDAKAYYPGRPGSQEEVKGQTSGSIEPSDVVVAPHIYASHKLNDRVALGMGVYVPFGSGTEYQRDSVLRYNLNELGLKTMALQPTVAFKINDNHSVAVGLVAQRTEAELRQYANFGSALAAFVPGQGNGTADGYAQVKGDDWGFGYNLAWLWNINDAARLGVNYRSHVRHTLQGDAEWKLESPVFQNALAAGAIRRAGYVEREDASVKITTPESLSVHGMYKLNPRWSLFGDLTWTRHSRFNRVELNFANSKDVPDPTQPPGTLTKSNQTILTPEWRDTWKVGLGAAYQVSDPLQLRFGWAYDQSPVKSADLRMSTLPDANRMWFSVGAKYDINPNHTLNAAYSYLHIQKSSANVNGWCGGTAAGAGSQACVSSRTNGSANFKSHAHILGLQYTYKF
ncbi:OmpP1/FadL family transporter [Neisseria shayeganii]|uniref:OMPP1/FadL/TodX family outer membrane protein n=1 Tax=Neisseria shayeganii 871 TaxID=1032488 RepID=G4CKW8_9NEIS|nr:OmpP1/FadL family transporter [Neisseria shayeganii]EGY51533.1 OMPP1/FadL/TodX family outer membrane protein [Neisseria shayeganii 871]